MHRSHLLPFCLLLFCLNAAGCTQRLPEPPDPEAGARALQAALDGWKAGRSPRDLREDRPKIHVADEDWIGGWSLAGYEIASDALPHGVAMSYPVELSLTDPRGRALKRRVRYAVAVEPSISITRQD